MKNLARVAMALFTLALAACAEPPAAGPPPPLSDQFARVYFLREINWNAPMIWTPVSLNGKTVGQSEPGTYFYRDVAPGTYQVTVRSERLYHNQVQTLNAAAGHAYYVQIYALEYAAYFDPMDIEYTFYEQILSPEAGRQELATLRPVAG